MVCLAEHDTNGERVALKHYSAALEISREIGDRQNEGIWLGNVGCVYEAQGRYREALVQYSSALGFAIEVGDRRVESYWLTYLGPRVSHERCTG